jgi:hypothetical protein
MAGGSVLVGAHDGQHARRLLGIGGVFRAAFQRGNERSAICGKLIHPVDSPYANQRLRNSVLERSRRSASKNSAPSTRKPTEKSLPRGSKSGGAEVPRTQRILLQNLWLKRLTKRPDI